MFDNHLEAFPHAYAVTLLEEVPTTELLTWYFPGASTKGGRDGIRLLIRPESETPWIGVFAGQGGLTAISSTDDKRKLLVVARGSVFLVDSGEPRTTLYLSTLFPISAVRPVTDRGLILLPDLTKIAAVNASGILWVTERISFDGISITSVKGEYIEGEAWDPTSRNRPTFRVNIKTGKHEGGSSPEQYRAR